MRGSVNREASLDVMVRMLGGSALGLLARPTQAELCEFTCQLPEGPGSMEWIINDRRLLTAARCVGRVPPSVAGFAVVHVATRLSAVDALPGHPGWDAATLDIDIELPQLSESAADAPRATSILLTESEAKAERHAFAGTCAGVGGSTRLVCRGEISDQLQAVDVSRMLRQRLLPALSGGAIQCIDSIFPVSGLGLPELPRGCEPSQLGCQASHARVPEGTRSPAP